MASVVQPDLQQQGLPLHLAFLAVLFSLLLSTLILVCYYDLSIPRIRRMPKLPPCPAKLPLVGNLHQLCGLPHHSLRALSRRHGPLMLLQLGQVPTLVVSSAETAQEVLKAHDLAFANRPRSRVVAALAPGGKGVGIAPYGEYWRQAKKVCIVHLLSPRRVQRFGPAREEEVARLVRKISSLSSSGGPINASRILSSFTSSLIYRAVVGESAVEGTTGEIADIVAQMAKALGGFQVDSFYPSLAWIGKFTGKDAKIAELAGRWRALLRKLMEKVAGRRVAGEDGGGFLDVLLSLQRDAAAVPSTDDEVQGILMSIISAGTDTSYLVLEASLGELVRNPQAMKKAREEARGVVARGMDAVVTEDDIGQMGYLKAVVKEALRLHPPAPLLLPRESMRAVQMRGGYEIPSKTRVLINAWAIARDPDFWESPEEFRPERFLEENRSVDFRGNDFHFIPFGSGRRICPGINFAVATIELALANLLYHFDWSPPEGITAAESDTDEAPGITAHKRSNLLLVAKPRPSSPEYSSC